MHTLGKTQKNIFLMAKGEGACHWEKNNFFGDFSSFVEKVPTATFLSDGEWPTLKNIDFPKMY